MSSNPSEQPPSVNFIVFPNGKLYLDGEYRYNKEGNLIFVKHEVPFQLGESSPCGDEPSPCGDESSSREDESLPCKDESSPCGDESLPCGDESPPCGDESLPCGDESLPCGDESLPCGDESLPCGDKFSPCGNTSTLSGYVANKVRRAPCWSGKDGGSSVRGINSIRFTFEGHKPPSSFDELDDVLKQKLLALQNVLTPGFCDSTSNGVSKVPD